MNNKSFNKEIIYFLEHENVHYIESNGSALLIFKDLKLAKTTDISNILTFTEKLMAKILKK